MSDETPTPVEFVKKDRKPLIKKIIVIAGTAAGLILSGFALGKTRSDDEDSSSNDDEATELMNIENSDTE